MAVGARLRHREDALALGLQAPAVAYRTDLGHRSRLGARTVAGRARLRGRTGERHLSAVDGLLEAERDLGFEVATASLALRSAADAALAGTAPGARPGPAEQVREDVADTAE